MTFRAFVAAVAVLTGCERSGFCVYITRDVGFLCSVSPVIYRLFNSVLQLGRRTKMIE